MVSMRIGRRKHGVRYSSSTCSGRGVKLWEGSSWPLLCLIWWAHHHVRRRGLPIPLQLGCKQRGDTEHFRSMAEVTGIGKVSRVLRFGVCFLRWVSIHMERRR